ncbi:hypothetical protein ABEB36_007757 [Hypothenemus hampei]|uniref:Uncharacterized protein n=1 Tax=Hypothenemus hampei TaxID=57062 RepID=A0ABD1EVN8_HYPHA
MCIFVQLYKIRPCYQLSVGTIWNNNQQPTIEKPITENELKKDYIELEPVLDAEPVVENTGDDSVLNDSNERGNSFKSCNNNDDDLLDNYNLDSVSKEESSEEDPDKETVIIKKFYTTNSGRVKKPPTRWDV